jgi:hypothetical protein
MAAESAPKEVPRAIDALFQTLERGLSASEALAKRLSPIVGGIETDNRKESARPERSSSLAADIDGATVRANEIANRLYALIETIQL